MARGGDLEASKLVKTRLTEGEERLEAFRILQFCIDNEAFQDCTLGLPYFIFKTGTQEKPAAFLYERGNSL
ncbi:hypothetical protein POTOM_061539 [Populus tomentosa]|uniref:Uncharacterized protein n=1 Tax=Populus tomentosa TaxID=118781 RepID=A0A8X7XQG7_POPTO|nr:hypothetical protein POTOM_061539 [Populus tomentosa]